MCQRQSLNNLRLKLAVLLVLTTSGAHADIYQYIDASGTPNFSNVSTDDRYTLIIKSEPAVELTTPKLIRSTRLQRANLKQYTPAIEQAASANNLDAALLHAVITVESGYNPVARSSKGARGLMQLMPETALRHGVSNVYDPVQNIQAGARYLKYLLQRFDNNLPLVLAAYNAGEGNVTKHGGRIPPFPETRSYVVKVMDWYQKYQRAGYAL